MKKKEITTYKKISEEYEGLLFKNYNLTDLMVTKKRGRKVRLAENSALYALLCSKLEEYGLSIFGVFERDGMQLRCVRLLPEFPVENEEILKQLYGFDGFVTHIQLRGFDSFSTAFDYNVDTGACELQRHSWGSVTDRIQFETLSEMMTHLGEYGHVNAFKKQEL